MVSHDRVFLDRTVTEVLAIDGHGRVAEIPGGVAGWLAERARRPSSGASSGAAALATPGPAAPTPAPRPVSKKSSSTLRRQLDAADRELAAAIAARDQLQAQLSEAATDHEALLRISSELGERQLLVDTTEERWLALADQAESIGMEM